MSAPITRRQFCAHVRYLRRLYAKVDDLVANAKTPIGRQRGEMCTKHLRCSVTLLMDAWIEEHGP